MKNIILTLALLLPCIAFSQALRIPNDINYRSTVGRNLGPLNITVHYGSPGVKGREGKIWGTEVAPYGYNVLGFGSNMPSPWRAGADEATTITLSHDALVNGRQLPAGKYALFMALYPDSITVIFNKNHDGWGSYFYNKDMDALHVNTRQQKTNSAMLERLEYRFENQTPNAVDLALHWENWKIPVTISIDRKALTLQDIQRQMSGHLGFDVPSLQAAADWSLQNDVNYEQALNWINSATNPALGGLNSFAALSTQAGLLEKLGRKKQSDSVMDAAMQNATVFELHRYGRQLLAQQKTSEALKVFTGNYNKHKGAWPTHVGMMRGYSASGDLKKALEHARLALPQAPDEQNKKVLQDAITQLSSGKPL